jgi:hypothetical protein
VPPPTFTGTPALPTATPTVIRGDVDGDGVLGANDVATLLDILYGGHDVTAGADANGDGRVSAADLTQLVILLVRVGVLS